MWAFQVLIHFEADLQNKMSNLLSIQRSQIGPKPENSGLERSCAHPSRQNDIRENGRNAEKLETIIPDVINIPSLTQTLALMGVRFGDKSGQIGTKWDKSGTFQDQFRAL